MSKINEGTGAVTAFQNRDNMRGLPFYGAKGDFNFTTGRSQFTPGISIKLLPLSDMSHNGDTGISEFDSQVNIIKHFFKLGDRIRGKIINSFIDSEEGRTVVGKLEKIKVDRRNHKITAFVRDPETLESTEIYVDTMERITEAKNLAMTFSQFINS
jgi:hypothetical protein